eukprot:scaffold1959_cov403-Prasinococcus_capsulatus_cf.AAC.12
MEETVEFEWETGPQETARAFAPFSGTPRAPGAPVGAPGGGRLGVSPTRAPPEPQGAGVLDRPARPSSEPLVRQGAPTAHHRRSIIATSININIIIIIGGTRTRSRTAPRRAVGAAVAARWRPRRPALLRPVSSAARAAAPGPSTSRVTRRWRCSRRRYKLLAAAARERQSCGHRASQEKRPDRMMAPSEAHASRVAAGRFASTRTVRTHGARTERSSGCSRVARRQHSLCGLVPFRHRGCRTPLCIRAVHSDADEFREGRLELEEQQLVSLLRLLQEKRASGGSEGARALGPVHLIGTGPGDPELLTLKAVRLMEEADLVLYDRLVAPEVLEHVSPGAQLIYVGKREGYHTRTQDQIHDIMLQFAQAGATVVRLKGGDPLVFGRGGEEAEYLAAHNVPVQIVPGITAASGVGANLGIPLTHRGLATSVRFLTGHLKEGRAEAVEKLGKVDNMTTLVVYMGLGTLPDLCKQLLEEQNLPAEIPAVAVERGTTPEQHVVFDDLAALANSVEGAGLKSPTLIIIGDVVALSPFWQKGFAGSIPCHWEGIPGVHNKGAVLAELN